MMDLSDLTETQKNIMSVIADGEYHHRSELQECLFDNMAGPSTLRTHMVFLRKRLRPKGIGIVTDMRGRDAYFRLVRLVGSATDGRR